MARQEIPLGDAPTGEGGDNAREAFTRVNQMTAELYEGMANLESGKVGTSDPRLSDSREWTAATVPQPEAEAGTSTTRRAWTAQRVWQAAAAWWAASAMKTKLDGIDAGAQANPAAASQAEAEAGTGTVIRSWTSQRIWQAIAAWWNASAMKSKLDGVAANATANATDAQLRDRSTHTGTQLAATISDLAAAVRAVTLAGINSSSAAITSGDTVLSALGKAMGSFVNALPRPTATDAVTLFADTAATAGWVNALMGGPYTGRQADHPDGATPAGTLDAVNYYWVLNILYAGGGGNLLQVAFPYASAAPNGRERIKFRIKGGSTWGAWLPFTVGTLTQSTVDVTAGRILKAGDGGWMGDIPVVTGSTNLDDRTIRGFRYYDNTVSGTQPSGVAAGIFNTFGIANNLVTQEFWEIITGTTSGRKWRRNCYGALAWSPWAEYVQSASVLATVAEASINTPSLQPGRYWVTAGSSGFLPLGSNGYLDHYTPSSGNAKQIYTPFYNSRTFIRIYNSGGWSPWSEQTVLAKFTSPQQSITNGGTITLAHGLSSVIRINVVLVCVTADIGYAVNTRLGLGTFQVHTASAYGFVALIDPSDSTKALVRVNTSGIYLSASGGFGAPTPINSSSWRIVLEVEGS
ncbi:pyocin knob domain-containing protein [Pseudomonas solani]|uniref:pyocin knob domain-containing protein n=1 Tax=Pseudomonas solani TaxID=2731552 RepID=UPI0035BE16D5